MTPPEIIVQHVEVDSTEDNAAKPAEMSRARYEQALHIGYVEMERIVEDIVLSEFHRIGEHLMENGYKVEIVVFDTECELEGKLYICGAGLKIERGYMKNAIVYTGDPHEFKFFLQTQNYASRTTEQTVDYHKLTPNWFHKRVKAFLEKTTRDVDWSHIDRLFTDDWEVLESPFSVKIRNEYGYFNEITKAKTIEEAFLIGSKIAEKLGSEEGLLLVDKNGREVC